MSQEPTIRIRRLNLQQQGHSKKIIIKGVNPEIWSIECAIDKLQLNLCRTKEVIAIDRGFYVDGKRSIKTLIVHKYYRRARDLMKWIPTARPVPEFVINESDLSSKVIEELESRIDYPKILTDILKQAVGRLFENLDFDRYHQSIARNLKVRVEP